MSATSAIELTVNGDWYIICGCAMMARRAEHRDPIRSIDRQPCTPSSGGAARQETAAQELPLDDQTPARIAPAVDPANARRLT